MSSSRRVESEADSFKTARGYDADDMQFEI